MGLHFKQLLSSGLRLVVRDGREKKKGVKKKKEKISSHPQMAARSNANVKRRRATAGAPAKEERTVAEHGGFADGYMSREMMESPSQMSQYHLISWDKTICVQRAAARPHLFTFGFFFFLLLTWNINKITEIQQTYIRTFVFFCLDKRAIEKSSFLVLVIFGSSS